MNSRRTFQVSSDLFWGYTETIDITDFQTVEDLCMYVKIKMKQFFKHHNLLALAEKIDTIKLHIHGEPSIQILLQSTNQNEIIYLCDHCK